MAGSGQRLAFVRAPGRPWLLASANPGKGSLKADRNTLQQAVRRRPRHRPWQHLMHTQQGLAMCSAQSAGSTTAQSAGSTTALDGPIRIPTAEFAFRLQEATELSELFRRVETVFAGGDVAAMAALLARMRGSLALVGHVPEFAGGLERLEVIILGWTNAKFGLAPWRWWGMSTSSPAV